MSRVNCSRCGGKLAAHVLYKQNNNVWMEIACDDCGYVECKLVIVERRNRSNNVSSCCMVFPDGTMCCQGITPGSMEV